MSNHYGTLRGALGRFHQGKNACGAVKEENYGAPGAARFSGLACALGRLPAHRGGRDAQAKRRWSR